MNDEPRGPTKKYVRHKKQVQRTVDGFKYVEEILLEQSGDIRSDKQDEPKLSQSRPTTHHAKGKSFLRFMNASFLMIQGLACWFRNWF